MKKKFLALIGAILAFTALSAQDTGTVPVVVDYNNPKTYTVGGISVSGTKYLGESQLLSVLGIGPGDKVPFRVTMYLPLSSESGCRAPLPTSACTSIPSAPAVIPHGCASTSRSVPASSPGPTAA